MRSSAALLAACACQSPPAGVDVDAAPDELGGGTLAVPGCGYDVRIGVGATPPALPGDFVGVDPQPRRIHLGIAGDPRTSMVVSWQTDDRSTEAGDVRFGPSAPGAALDQVVPAITWRYRDTRGGEFRMHEAHLCGLAPDTLYRYRVHSGPAASPERAFRTAPGPDADIVVAALGDSRGDPATFGALVALADGFSPDLYLYTGDAVVYGSNQDAWTAFFDAGGPPLSRAPTLAAVGNHDAGAIAHFSQWALPGDERWFGLDYGPAHIAVLDDSSLLYPDENGDGERFLRAHLPALPAEGWRIVAHHQPIYSAFAVGGHGSTLRLQQRWAPLYDEHGVDLVLNGHDHKYERTHPLRAGVRDDAGTVYVVTGGAGAPLYDAGTDVWTAATASAQHMVILRVSPARIDATVYGLGGTVLDAFSLLK